MKLRAFDYISIVLSAAVVGAAAWFAYSGRSRPGDVVVEAPGAEWIYPLSADRQFAVDGPLGATVVVIDGGVARVADSPCPDKLCVAMAAVSKPGQWIACLPNRVFVRVRGRATEEVDDSAW